ncbi:NADH-cytochrome b5 reductase 1 [Zancudomyces culisetae]|uniref:NADH-cytochrome b5 reductase n=1 Tax=Zancudomyces culisetae TaxID=1213189 RepID=A0A1R1PLT6_ZANCU|nr:NADH-cytochrome b5 reductase 1 [Zancudomyces culisetae]|eukprot:OMH81924.1 NADH-cytochrome b5 reductase 1 [Zancudomyces culisetae]
MFQQAVLGLAAVTFVFSVGAILYVKITGTETFVSIKDQREKKLKQNGGSSQIALSKTEFRNFKLIEKYQISSNTYRLIFQLADKNQILGLGLGQCVSVKMNINGKEIMRSYTPVSKLNELGQFELVVKVYPTGVMTPALKDLQVGQNVSVRGPKGNFVYKPEKFKQFIMLAGGSGITPMYQVIQELLANNADTTKITLVYANVGFDDILLKSELDNLAKQHSDRFVLHYVLEKPSGDWVSEGGSVGYITKDIILNNLDNSLIPQTQALLCGPLPMIKAMEGHLESIGFQPADLISKPDHQIYKF